VYFEKKQMESMNSLSAAPALVGRAPPPLPLQDRRTNYIVDSATSAVVLAADAADTTALLLDALVSGGVFFTDSRVAFFRDFARNLGELDVSKTNPGGRLKREGVCAVIIAQKGYGKTFLLKSMIHAARKVTKRTLYCYLNYNTTASDDTPVQVIRKLLQDALPETLRAAIPNWRTLDDMCAWLEHVDQRLVLFVDELEAVFPKPRAVGVPIIADLVTFAEPTMGPRI
jgi:hypothetical protein